MEGEVACDSKRDSDLAAYDQDVCHVLMRSLEPQELQSVPIFVTATLSEHPRESKRGSNQHKTKRDVTCILVGLQTVLVPESLMFVCDENRI